MLKFITGPAGSGKTTAIYDAIANSDGKVIFIVPDQFLFETEKQIAEKIKRRKGNIVLSGFNTLAEDIIKKFGKGLSYADTAAKSIIMQRAVRQAAKSLDFYGTKALKPGFSQFMLKTVDELKRGGIGCEDIDRVCGYDDVAAATGGALKSKLSDISLIYRLYDGMLTKSFDDRQDNMKAAARLAAENEFFEGCRVFIDGFDHLGGAQLLLVEQIVKKAADCTVALTLTDIDSDYFLQQSKLKNAIAGFSDGEYNEEILSGDYRYNSPALKALRGALPTDKKFTAENTDDIKLYYFPDAQAEAETACAEIMRLVRENGYRYRDIAVLTPSPEIYADKLSSSALLYGIPLFADIPSPLAEKPLLKYITSLLFAAYNPTGENVIRYIKSGFVRIKKEGGSTALSDKDIYALESYCEQWDMYDRDFTRAFKSVQGKQEPPEELRRLIVTPLKELKKSCKDKNGKEITRLVTEFLFSENDISAAIKGKCRDLSSDEYRYDKQLTDEYNQLWNMISELLSSLYNTISEDEIYTLGEYAELLKACAGTIEVSRTPRVIDSVIFGDTVRTRCTEVKAVFVLGATADKLPSLPSPSEIFTKQELQLLYDNEFYPEKDEEEMYSEQLMSVYNALCQPSDKLFISYSGDKEGYAECVGLIKSSLGTEISTEVGDYLLYCASIGSAKAKLAEFSVTAPENAAEIKKALISAGETEYTSLVDNALYRRGDNAANHDIGECAPLLLGRGTLSPTAVTELCGCRFAYFLKYGLGLGKSESAKLNSANIGTMGHYIFSTCFKEIYKNGKPKAGYQPNFRQLVNDAVLQYRKEALPEGEEMPPQFERMFENLADVFTVMLEYLYIEQQKSGFIPKYYELELRNGGKTEDNFSSEPFDINIRMPNGEESKISMRGIIDRVDIYTDENGKKQIRIVDYKTYEKKTDFAKNYFGLDLQILLYLFALTDCNKDSIPSAAVYYPVHKLPTDASVADDADSRLGLWLMEHRQQGIAVINSLAAMEKPLYTVPTVTASGKPTEKNCFDAVRMSESTLNALRRRAESVISDSAEKVLMGDVSAQPVTNGYKRVSCEYCKFSEICGFNGSGGRDISSADAVSFKDKMTAEENELTQQEKPASGKKGGKSK